MHPDDIPKTAFITHKGLLEFTCMPFGFSTTASLSQCVMSCVLAGLICVCVFVYLDDIIVFKGYKVTHRTSNTSVFVYWEGGGWKWNVQTVCVCPWRVLLGYVITPEGIQAQDRKIAAIKTMREQSLANIYQTILRLQSHWVDVLTPRLFRISHDCPC